MLITTKETWYFLFAFTRKVQILELNENKYFNNKTLKSIFEVNLSDQIKNMTL